MKRNNRASLTKLALGLIFLTGLGWAEGRWSPLYSSANLTNHDVSFECSPGDPTTNCPCGTNDVAIEIFADYGAITANTRLTNVYVNAIGYKRFSDVYPDGRPIDLDIFKYKADIRLPVVPIQDPSQTQNAQSAHIMIQLWDGSNRVWQADKVALEATLFWVLNPWQTNDFGKVYAYTTTTGPLEYVDTGLTLDVDTNWHSWEFVADFVNKKFVSATADGARADLNALAIARVLRTNWANELVYHLTTESCPTYPNPGYTNIYTWTVHYRNLEWSRLKFDTEIHPATISNSAVSVQWDSEPYMKYQVWTSANMETWQNMSTTMTGNGTMMLYSTPVTNVDRLFYRMHVVP